MRLERPGGALVLRCIALAALLVAILSAACPPARAWGDEGHRITALVAYAHLTPAAKDAVNALLAADDDTMTAPDFASRATWADKFRDSDRNTTQERYRLTRAWHFVDIELDGPDLDAACFGHPSAGVPASSGPSQACVVDRIGAFDLELRDPTTPQDERLLAFKFLLHFVGDVHQPLHSADNHDRGGNDVLVLFGNHTVGKALHGLWDTDAVVRLGTDPAEVASEIDAQFATQCAGWMTGTPADWAQESFGLARDDVYQLGDASTDAHGKQAFRLAANYQQAAGNLAAQQLEKAGCRLAMTLNGVLDRNQACPKLSLAAADATVRGSAVAPPANFRLTLSARPSARSTRR